MTHPYWPLFDLEVRTPRLTLRGITDELGVELAALAARGIHPPGFMPFGMPWSRRPSPELEREALRFQWRTRVETTPASWNVNLAVLVDGEVVGTTGLTANDFPRTREFGTGSWLGSEFQGRGLGTEMRIATLALGFDGFGADWATTGAWHDNAASLGVTRRLGYVEQGHRRAIRDDREPDTLIGFEMSRAHFEQHVRRDDIELIGVEPARELLGI